jgi:hypothetical protein
LELADFVLVAAIVFGLPFAGVIWGTRRLAARLRIRHERVLHRVSLLCAALVIVTALGIAAQVGTSSFPADVAITLAACVAYCFLAAAVSTGRSMLQRVAGVAAYVVLVPVYLYAAAVPFSHFDQELPPAYTEQLRPDLSCEIVEWGMFAQNGTTVYVYRHPPFFPFVRVEAARDVEAGQPYWKSESAACARLASHVR